LLPAGPEIVGATVSVAFAIAETNAMLLSLAVAKLLTGNASSSGLANDFGSTLGCLAGLSARRLHRTWRRNFDSG
jgi:hypothetical protein